MKDKLRISLENNFISKIDLLYKSNLDFVNQEKQKQEASVRNVQVPLFQLVLIKLNVRNVQIMQHVQARIKLLLMLDFGEKVIYQQKFINVKNLMPVQEDILTKRKVQLGVKKAIMGFYVINVFMMNLRNTKKKEKLLVLDALIEL